MSSKVVRKTDPAEKVGLVVVRRRPPGDDRVLRPARRPCGAARGRMGVSSCGRGRSRSTSSTSRSRPGWRAATGGCRSTARASRCRTWTSPGGRIEPDVANAVKFEQFIFDALPLAERALVVETDRETEFEPLKNASGPASPETVRARMSDVYAGWLEAAGVAVPRGATGCLCTRSRSARSSRSTRPSSPGGSIRRCASRAPCSFPDPSGPGPRPVVTRSARWWADAGRARHPASRRGAPCAPRQTSRFAERASPVCPTSPGRRVPAAAVPRRCRSASAASVPAAGWGSTGPPPLSPTRASAAISSTS